MNWEMIAAIVAILSFGVTLFVEWPRITARIAEPRPATLRALTIAGLILGILGLPIIIVGFLSVVFGYVPNPLPGLGFIFAGIGLGTLSTISWFASHKVNWGAVIISVIFIIYGSVLLVLSLS